MDPSFIINSSPLQAVGAYRTETLYFDDFSPQLLTTLAQFRPDPNGYRTDAKPDSRLEGVSSGDDDRYFGDDDGAADRYREALDAGGSGSRNLTLAGTYFGSDEGALAVTVGGEDCGVWPGSLAEVDPAVAGVSFGDVVRSVQCRLPPGTGDANEVVLSRNGKTSFSGDGVAGSNRTNVLFAAYEPPSISDVTPTNVHTEGGGVVTISGRNFGPDRDVAAVLYGGAPLLILNDGSFSHTSMKVVVPEGDGTGSALSVLVDGQIDTVYPSAEAAALAGVDDVDDNDFVSGFKCECLDYHLFGDFCCHLQWY